MITLYACAASHRPDSINRTLLNYALDQVSTHAASWQLTSLDYDGFITPAFNDAQRLSHGIPPEVEALHHHYAEAQAWMFAVPEYNSSCPGAFKNTLDWLSVFSPNVFANKPVMLLCATPSERGGLMGLMHTRHMLESLGMQVFPTLVSIGKAHEVFTPEGAWLKPAKQTIVAQYVAQFCSWVHQHHGSMGS